MSRRNQAEQNNTSTYSSLYSRCLVSGIYSAVRSSSPTSHSHDRSVKERGRVYRDPAKRSRLLRYGSGAGDMVVESEIWQ